MGIGEENREKDLKRVSSCGQAESGTGERVRSLRPALEKPGCKLQQMPAAASRGKSMAAAEATLTLSQFVGSWVISLYPQTP